MLLQKTVPFPGLLLVLMFAGLPVRGQGTSWQPMYTDAEIILDGRLEETVWQSAPPVGTVVYEPTYGQTPTEETDIRVVYDRNYLYVGARLLTADPATIRANSLYRDQYLGDDILAVIIDPFNDNLNGLWFMATPAGTRIDMAISADGGGGFGRSINRSWNTFWDVATTQDETGWFAEVRIPFSSLGFQVTGEQTTMGMSMYRFMATKNERHVFPRVSPAFDMGFAKPSQSADVVFQGIASATPLYISPYVLGGTQTIQELNDASTAYQEIATSTREIGVDIKSAITSNLTLDLTINTDFAQVEADDAQVNLSRYSLYLPEKRQFFQERASIFDFAIGGRDRLFYSRRIGLSDDGDPLRILAGGRLSGRIGQTDVGILNLQTASRDSIPSTNFGVYRVMTRVKNDRSYAGAILTSRLDAKGQQNYVWGGDTRLNFKDNHILTVQVAQSLDSDHMDTTSVRPFTTGLYRFRFDKEGRVGFTYSGALTRVGADFDPAVGFMRRTDYTQPYLDLGYGMLLSGDSRWQELGASVSGMQTIRNSDGSSESGRLWMRLSATTKRGLEVSANSEYSYEDLLEDLELIDGVIVPAGSYQALSGQVNVRPSDQRLLRSSLSLEGGRFFDGSRLSVGIEPEWNISQFVQLSGTYELNRVRFHNRDEGFDAHIVRVKSQAALNNQLSASVFLQYSSAADQLSTNVRLRYNPREGNDLWVVYNDAVNTDPLQENPRLPTVAARAVQVKYTHTFSR